MIDNSFTIDQTLLNNILNGQINIREFNVTDLLTFIKQWQSILIKQRQLVDLPNTDILIVGDIHGDYTQVKRAFYLFEEDKLDFLVFNGDIIDRGSDMMECLLHIMAGQLLYPGKIIYIRGNHELRSINEIYGFRGYCSGLWGSKIYDEFSKAFQQLPIATKISDWGFVCHGGVPNTQIYFHMMRLELKQKEPKTGPYAQLMWNDPDPRIEYFAPSSRGNNFYRFGNQAFKEFMEFHNLTYFIRAHQAFPEGYRWFFDDQLLSIFSSKAGPYSKVDPHFALLKKKEIDLVKCSNIDF